MTLSSPQAKSVKAAKASPVSPAVSDAAHASPPDAGAAHRPPANLKTLSAAGVFIAVVIGGAAAYWLREILTPLALAIFLLVMVEGFTQWLKARAKLPDWLAMTAALVALAGIFLLSTVIVANNATEFVGQISSYAPRLNSLIADVAGAVGLDVPPTVDELFARLNPTRYLREAALGFQSFVSNAVFVLIYLGFLIASRAGFKRKWQRLFPRAEDRAEALVAVRQIRMGVEKYLWVQTVTGLVIAVISWIVMAIVGLDNAFFWAFLIFITGYIPIIGPLIGGLAPPIFALVQFDSYGPAIILLVALNALNFGVSNVLLPRMQGESLNLDPVSVLLSLAFWGALWGVSGMFLSTPLTVMTMVILAQFRGSHWIAVLMSGDGHPLGDLKPKSIQHLKE